MNYERNLKLTGRSGDSFVCYPTDDEDHALVVSIKTVLPNGEISLAFSGDDYQVWRSAIYEKGRMNK